MNKALTVVFITVNKKGGYGEKLSCGGRYWI